jgi:tRNA G18 (ribose-2'-O)-methylase SpoU
MPQKLTMAELNRLDQQEFIKAPKLPVVIVLDNIRSQNNTGSIFRTADAFRIESICLCGITATPPHREIHKTALGATETVVWKYYPETMNAITELINNGYRIIAVEQAHSSIPLNEFQMDINEKIALVFGNEVEGVDESVLHHSAHILEIPQFGTKHSLNVAVSVGIVIWDIFSRTFSQVVVKPF